MTPRRCILIICCFLPLMVFGQGVKVRSLELYGLKRTKEHIIHREMTFHQGDTLPQSEIGNIFERNRSNLLNLAIFNEVTINIAEWDTEKNEIDVVVEFRESWYVYAVPIVEIADRNFNVWWTTYNHSLDRLNLGARLDYLNFTGRNDKLKSKLQFGYTPKQEIEYRFPYFNKKQSLGLIAGALHSVNKEINFISAGNKEQFLKLDDARMHERWRGQVKLQYRPSHYLRHELTVMYEHMKVHETVLEHNPNYFRKGNTQHGIFSFNYSYEYDERDLRIYPTKGVKAAFDIEKTGLHRTDDENTLTSTVSTEWNHTISGRFLQRISGIGQYSLSRSRPSYVHYKALGYEQRFVRGYELYVIDGLDYVTGKYQLSWQMLQEYIRWGKLIPVEQFNRMPLQVYVSLHLEAGRVHDPFTGDVNPLANTWLFGQGLGLNLLLYHNFLFQLTFSRNHLGEVGFFVHNHTSF